VVLRCDDDVTDTGVLGFQHPFFGIVAGRVETVLYLAVLFCWDFHACLNPFGIPAVSVFQGFVGHGASIIASFQYGVQSPVDEHTELGVSEPLGLSRAE
jgi:hypothetical protein